MTPQSTSGSLLSKLETRNFEPETPTSNTQNPSRSPSQREIGT
jgi:hypothetical protein